MFNLMELLGKAAGVLLPVALLGLLAMWRDGAIIKERQQFTLNETEHIRSLVTGLGQRTEAIQLSVAGITERVARIEGQYDARKTGFSTLEFQVQDTDTEQKPVVLETQDEKKEEQHLVERISVLTAKIKTGKFKLEEAELRRQLEIDLALLKSQQAERLVAPSLRGTTFDCGICERLCPQLNK